MGRNTYFHLFTHKNKLHIHKGYCYDGKLYPWFISNDDVTDIDDELDDREPEDVSDHRHKWELQRTFIFDVYKERLNNFDELYSKTEELLTKDDLKRFEEFVNEEFYGGFINDYKEYERWRWFDNIDG